MSADPVFEFVVGEPAKLVTEFAARLRDGRVTLASGRAALEYNFAHSDHSLERMLAVLKSWKSDGGTEQLLARTVTSHLEVSRQLEELGPSCELVWTGHGEGGAGVRSTLPVVMEMLGHARREVLVVTYSVWLGFAEAKSVIDRLALLSSKGVSVTFVLDAGYRDGHNVREVQRHWPPERRRPTIWTWQDPSDEVAKLHAKVLEVDGHDLLVTSANLTGHALGENVEIGLRVRGAPAAQAVEHFRALILSGEFDKVDW